MAAHPCEGLGQIDRPAVAAELGQFSETHIRQQHGYFGGMVSMNTLPMPVE